MPLVIAPLVALALGALFGFGLGLPDRAADLHFGRRSVALFACLAFAPVPAYFAWSVPSWSVAYLWNGERIPSAIVMAAVIASAALVLAGFELVQHAIAEGHARRALAGGFAAAIAAIVILAALASRLWQVGSFAEVSEGFPVLTLVRSMTGLGVLGMNALLMAATWITLQTLRRPSSAPIPPVRQSALQKGGHPGSQDRTEARLSSRPSRVGRSEARPNRGTRR